MKCPHCHKPITVTVQAGAVKPSKPKPVKVGDHIIDVNKLASVLKKKPTPDVFMDEDQIEFGGRSPGRKPTIEYVQKPITHHLAPPGAKLPMSSHHSVSSLDDNGMGSYQDFARYSADN